MEKDKVSKLNSVVKKILKVLPKFLYDLLIIFCVLLTLIIVLQRITDSNQSFYGIRIFSVASGSMVPQFGIGEVVICQDKNPKEIEVGDVIVYRGNVGELKNRLVMHEVVSIDTDENGYRTFHVKGIQNTAGDPDVKENQVLGKVIIKSLILSILYALATSTYASFIIIIILVINVFLAFKPSREPMQLNEHNEVHKEENEEKIQEEIENKEEIEETDVVVEKEEKKETKKRKSTSKKKTVETSEKVKEKIDEENIEEISKKKEPKKRKTTSKKKEENVEDSENEVEEKDSNKEIEISDEKPKTKNVTKKKKSSKNKEEIGDKGKSEN